MKKIILVFFPLLLLLPNAISAIGNNLSQPIQKKSLSDLDRADILKLNKTVLEKKLNRKITLKEKLALLFVKKKLKRHPELSTTQATEYANYMV